MIKINIVAFTFCVMAMNGTAFANDDFDACPRHLIRDAIAQGVNQKDTPELLSIEDETLTLCERRTKRLADITKNDQRLQELRFGKADDTSEEINNHVEKTPNQNAALAPVTPLRPLFGPMAPPSVMVEPVKDKKPVPPKPNLHFFSVYGLNDDLRAGITDGTTNWHVRAGDKLPNGSKIISIDNDPISVSVSENGKTIQLPEGQYAGN